MARILQWVAITHAVLLAAVLIAGMHARSLRRQEVAAAPVDALMPEVVGVVPTLSMEDADAPGTASATHAALTMHVALGVFALLLACLIHTGVFTYFTVTGKLIQQSLALGKFDMPTGMAPVKRRKAWIGRMLGASIVPIVVVVGTGAWGIADVPRQRWHFAGALLMTLLHCIVYVAYYRLIVENGRQLETAMVQYQKRATKRRSDGATERRREERYGGTKARREESDEATERRSDGEKRGRGEE